MEQHPKRLELVNSELKISIDGEVRKSEGDFLSSFMGFTVDTPTLHITSLIALVSLSDVQQVAARCQLADDVRFTTCFGR